MPVTEKTIVVIGCDNPACPGNELDPNDRMGWTFISTEVVDATTRTAAEYVYCSPACAGTLSTALTAREDGA